MKSMSFVYVGFDRIQRQRLNQKQKDGAYGLSILLFYVKSRENEFETTAD
jgi:hypothetical protein